SRLVSDCTAPEVKYTNMRTRIAPVGAEGGTENVNAPVFISGTGSEAVHPLYPAMLGDPCTRPGGTPTRPPAIWVASAWSSIGQYPTTFCRSGLANSRYMGDPRSGAFCVRRRLIPDAVICA